MILRNKGIKGELWIQWVFAPRRLNSKLKENGVLSNWEHYVCLFAFFIFKQNCNLKANLNWVMCLDIWEILYLLCEWFIDAEERNQELIKNAISIFDHWRLHPSLLTVYLSLHLLLWNIYCVPPTYNYSASNYKQIMKLCKTLILF